MPTCELVHLIILMLKDFNVTLGWSKVFSVSSAHLGVGANVSKCNGLISSCYIDFTIY